MTEKPGPLLDHYLRSMAESIKRWEGTEKTYSDVFDMYEERLGKGWLADVQAGGDARVRQAQGDGAWFRDRASTYALGAIALMLHEQHYPQGGAE